MALLHAAITPNPSLGGGDITVVGGAALLSENGPVGTIVDVEEKKASDQISIYVVREGDSLSQIARMFNVNVNTIIWANDIKNRVINPGQTLVILPISGVQHTVVEGDTLERIAKKYEADLSEIIRYNSLHGVSLKVGEIVVVPDGEIPAPKIATPASQKNTAPRNIASGPEYQGYYLRPISGGVRTQGLHGYNGVDLATYTGAPVYAAAAGTVLISKDYGWNGGYGNYVVIRHENGTQTLYAHNSNNIVVSGQYVVQGQVIGYVGSTGKSTGPHLHFEVRGAKNPF